MLSEQQRSCHLLCLSCIECTVDVFLCICALSVNILCQCTHVQLLCPPQLSQACAIQLHVGGKRGPVLYTVVSLVRQCTVPQFLLHNGPLYPPSKEGRGFPAFLPPSCFALIATSNPYQHMPHLSCHCLSPSPHPHIHCSEIVENPGMLTKCKLWVSIIAQEG
jgi:hypothetical protein